MTAFGRHPAHGAAAHRPLAHLVASGSKAPVALRKRGVQVQYLVTDNEGHGFANEENRFEFCEAKEGFLQQHLKP